MYSNTAASVVVGVSQELAVRPRLVGEGGIGENIGSRLLNVR